MSNSDFTDADLETYAAKYSGLTKLKRLLFIADKCAAVQGTALKMVDELSFTTILKHKLIFVPVLENKAITELKQGSNTEQYFEVLAGVGSSLGDAYSLDEEWIQKTKHKTKQEVGEVPAFKFKITTV